MLRTSPFHIYLDHIETAANSLGYKVFTLPSTKGWWMYFISQLNSLFNTGPLSLLCLSKLVDAWSVLLFKIPSPKHIDLVTSLV